MKNPFASSLFEPGSVTVPSIHQSELDTLFARMRELEAVPFTSSAPGASVLLSASRAGAGKTHLLARCQALSAGHVYWVPLPFAPEQDLSWKELTLALATRLHSAADSQGTSPLDATAWFAFSRLVQAGIGKGKVIAEDPASAREQLDSRFREIFAPGVPESRFRWFLGTADSLLTSCGAACAAEIGGDTRVVAAWMRWLLAYAYPKSPPANRGQRLLGQLERASGTPRIWKERFQVLARLASGVAPLIWAVDHLDRFFAAPQASRQLIAQLSEVVAMVPRSLLLLSANQDLWQQVLVPGVPGAIQDRIAAQSIQLRPLRPDQAEELVMNRLFGVARADAESRAFLRRLDFRQIPGSGGLTPRAILRWASAAWDMRDSPPSPTSESSPANADLPTVQRARETLHAVAEALRAQSGPAMGGIQAADPAPAGAANPPEPVSTPPPPRPPATLAEEFQALRLQHLAENGETKPDWKRIHRLVATVGQRFPSIRQRHLDSGASCNGEALCWAIANREIFIGFAPASSSRFWRALLETPTEADAMGLSREKRVVMLTPAWESVALDELMTESAAVALDVLAIDSDLAASLHAADDLVQAKVRGAGDVPEARVFGFLAKELDFFWRRLTRRAGARAVRQKESASTA